MTNTRFRVRTAAALLGPVLAGMVTACPVEVPTTPGGIACAGATLTAAVTPGFRADAGPNVLSLRTPSATVPCRDRSGNGITSGRLAAMELSFGSIGCFSEPGTTGAGDATIEWSDGSVSAADATATMDSAVSGALDVVVTSGRFEGMVGRTTFSARPAEGDCVGGVSGETVSLEAIRLAPRRG